MAQPKKVLLFSQPGLPPCNTAKAYLSERGIPFEERDVRADQKAVFELVRTYRSQITPTIVVDGEVVVGFDRQRLEKLLSE